MATITWQVTNDGTNWVTPKEADGTTDAVSIVADITVLGCYRLPAELFDFKCFRPVCGVMQYDARTITYFLGG